jgi:hypothetical protein
MRVKPIQAARCRNDADALRDFDRLAAIVDGQMSVNVRNGAFGSIARYSIDRKSKKRLRQQRGKQNEHARLLTAGTPDSCIFFDGSLRDAARAPWHDGPST